MGKILIVDDDANIRESIKGILEDAGYQVETAFCYPDAEDKLRAAKHKAENDTKAQDISMVLCDCHMVMSEMMGYGIEKFAKKYSQLKNSREEPYALVLFTGDAGQREMNGCKEDFVSTLGKPTKIDDLLASATMYATKASPTVTVGDGVFTGRAGQSRSAAVE